MWSRIFKWICLQELNWGAIKFISWGDGAWLRLLLSHRNRLSTIEMPSILARLVLLLMIGLLAIFSCIASESIAQSNREGKVSSAPRQIYADDSWHFTSEGNLGLTVTNFGVFGRTFDESYSLLNQPSCVYKLNSSLPKEQVEHFSYGGIWIGGVRGGITHVSTGITDGSFSAGEPGLEFTNTASEADSVQTRSSILTSPLFDPSAISHQDLICDYSDTNTVLPGTLIPIPQHVPLGIGVHQEVYCWNYSYADAFAILSFTITNLTNEPIEDLHVAIWLDASVGNMNYTNYEPGGGPGGRWNWYDNLNNFVQNDEQKIAISYDEDSDDGWAESYLGVTVLGGESKADSFDVYFHQWPWNTSSSMSYPLWIMPIDDEERYTKMATHGEYDQIPGYDNQGNPTNPGEVTESWMLFLSCGPFETIQPGESVEAIFSIVCGRWSGNYPDDVPARRTDLLLNAEWAQTIYNGEDVNGNGILDPDEDLNGNGILDHYLFPKPPPSPRLEVVPGDGQVTLYWDNSAEAAVDSLTGKMDFEGYRVYSSPKTLDLGEEYSLLAQFDIDYDLDPFDDDSTLVGFNTGFSAIELEDSVLINGDYYHYSFTDNGVLNGWPSAAGGLYYAVTAYDRGNPQNNLPSLESSPLENRIYTYPGTTPTDDSRVGVYPNPYRVSASWDGPGPTQRMIWFQYLPARAEIRIFTLAGDLVDTIDHDAATYDGGDVARIGGSTYGSQTAFSGGEHAWDLLNSNNQEIATGLYLYTVENMDSGSIKTGTFMVIK
ncbi:hypothetical protein CEE37_01785 [candidate division LCP-89 bacterium B3_LCP]|uniref:Uncharacterized protein n=1 Tax=candidate division LCP-89 bacterium B3_LCP TaxID=2012998 RepID=A0A532V647_UNCL8|nr:MAG: hypothetical protein CEE37_01785 [candidate division LCP-89 bacterium B3_LCP]